MKHLRGLLLVASAAFFIANAQAQNAGTVTNHAFTIGKGAGNTAYTSLLCGSAQLAVGQSAADPICRTVTGDGTLSAAGALSVTKLNGVTPIVAGTALQAAFYASAGSVISGSPNVFFGASPFSALAIGLTVLPIPARNINNGATIGPGSGPNGEGSFITTWRQNGTTASPTAILNADELGGLQFLGWNGTAFAPLSANTEINAIATENWDGTHNGSAILIQATPNGSIVGQGEACFVNGMTAINVPGSCPQGLGQGTVNAKAGLFDNGNRAYSAGNVPLGAGVTTFLGTPSSANLAAAVTDETGAGALVFANQPVINGVTSGAAAAAGQIGQVLSSTINQATGGTTGFTTGTPKTITSIPLTAGDWNVWGTVCANPAGTTTISQVAGGLSTTNNAFSSDATTGVPGTASLNLTFTPGTIQCTPIGQTVVNVSGSTTLFLVAQFSFGVSTMGGYGSVFARRMH